MVFVMQKYDFNSDRKLNFKKVLGYGNVLFFKFKFYFKFKRGFVKIEYNKCIAVYVLNVELLENTSMVNSH